MNVYLLYPFSVCICDVSLALVSGGIGREWNCFLFYFLQRLCSNLFFFLIMYKQIDDAECTQTSVLCLLISKYFIVCVVVMVLFVLSMQFQ